jgi:peptidylprolyl isomerase/FKBP-type peptidyl-prolyl cis-trans isomerase FklB
MLALAPVLIAMSAATLSGCGLFPFQGSVTADRVPLDSNATRFVATASGLRYRVVRSGEVNGPLPVDGDKVTFDYEGKLLDGTVFDSSFARGMPISGAVGQFVPGFNEALKLMRPGDEWIVWVPPALGYGEAAAGPIPANSTLRFRMALRSVTPATR